MAEFLQKRQKNETQNCKKFSNYLRVLGGNLPLETKVPHLSRKCSGLTFSSPSLETFSSRPHGKVFRELNEFVTNFLYLKKTKHEEVYFRSVINKHQLGLLL